MTPANRKRGKSITTWRPFGLLPPSPRLDAPVGVHKFVAAPVRPPVRKKPSSRAVASLAAVASAVACSRLNHQPIGALTLALEVCPVTRCGSFEPRDLRVQCGNLCRHGDVVRLATTCWSWRMPYLGKIHAHQRLAIIRKRARHMSVFRQTSAVLRKRTALVC